MKRRGYNYTTNRMVEATVLIERVERTCKASGRHANTHLTAILKKNGVQSERKIDLRVVDMGGENSIKDWFYLNTKDGNKVIIASQRSAGLRLNDGGALTEQESYCTRVYEARGGAWYNTLFEVIPAPAFLDEKGRWQPE